MQFTQHLRSELEAPEGTIDVIFLLKLYVSCRLITVRGADEDLVLGRPEQKTL